MNATIGADGRITAASNGSGAAVVQPTLGMICARGSDPTIGAVTITSGSSDSSTMTFGAASGFNKFLIPAGQTVTVAGVTNPASGENGNYVVASGTDSSIVLTSANNPGNWVAGGTISFACSNSTDSLTGSKQWFPDVAAMPTIVAGKVMQIIPTFESWTTSTAPGFIFIWSKGTSVSLSNSGTITLTASQSRWGWAMPWEIANVDTTHVNAYPLSVGIPGATNDKVANSIVGPINLSTNTAYNLDLTMYFAATGLGSITSYTSGASVTGTAGQTCLLSTFGSSCSGSTATATLVSPNTLTGATFVVTNTGFACTTNPTTANVASGSATCSGTGAIFVTVAGGAQGNAVRMTSLAALPIN